MTPAFAGTLARMDDDPPAAASTDPADPRQGRIKRMLNRFVATPQELEAQELLSDAEQVGTPISRARDREQLTVCGTLRTVTLRPRAGVPALEAELYDGSGSLAIVWLGRRQIGGIEPGRALVAHGRVSMSQGRPVMFNPRYELRPVGAS
jgi:hypothetical protein